MSTKLSTKIALLAAVLVPMGTGLAQKNSDLPNIVFFFADDLGYGDLAVYGHPYAKTPALDRLATQGTMMVQHYVTGITCNPSRTGLMTGKFPAQAEKYQAFHGFGDWTSITELLKERGYRTGHFGKWHMGPKSSEKAGTYGLDVVDVIGNSADDNDGRDDDLTSAAVRFIKESTGKDQPFYVNIWGHSTHFPVHVSKDFTSKFIEVKVNRSDFSESMQHKFDECLQIGGNLDDSMRQYLGDVYSMDANVGRVMETLDELGIADNTIFVFSSDHGPAPVILGKGHRTYSENMLGYASIYRGGKHTQLEGGVRVPFIIRWPGKVPAGKVNSESVTSFVDWLPTLAAITGIEDLPTDLDGEDISDIWLGSDRTTTRPLFWTTSSAGSDISLRVENWKAHLSPRRGDFKLYNLATDPAEKKNLTEERPRVAKELKAQIETWAAKLPADYLKNEGGKRQSDDD